MTEAKKSMSVGDVLSAMQNEITTLRKSNAKLAARVSELEGVPTLDAEWMEVLRLLRPSVFNLLAYRSDELLAMANTAEARAKTMPADRQAESAKLIEDLGEQREAWLQMQASLDGEQFKAVYGIDPETGERVEPTPDSSSVVD